MTLRRNTVLLCVLGAALSIYHSMRALTDRMENGSLVNCEQKSICICIKITVCCFIPFLIRVHFLKASVGLRCYVD